MPAIASLLLTERRGDVVSCVIQLAHDRLVAGLCLGSSSMKQVKFKAAETGEFSFLF